MLSQSEPPSMEEAAFCVRPLSLQVPKRLSGGSLHWTHQGPLKLNSLGSFRLFSCCGLASMNGRFCDCPWRRRASGTGKMELAVERSSASPGLGLNHQGL